MYTLVNNTPIVITRAIWELVQETSQVHPTTIILGIKLIVYILEISAIMNELILHQAWVIMDAIIH